MDFEQWAKQLRTALPIPVSRARSEFERERLTASAERLFSQVQTARAAVRMAATPVQDTAVLSGLSAVHAGHVCELLDQMAVLWAGNPPPQDCTEWQCWLHLQRLLYYGEHVLDVKYGFGG